MKTRILFILLFLIGVTVHAQTIESVAEAKTRLAAKITEIQRVIGVQKAPMLGAYGGALDAIQKKLAAAGDLDGALAAKRERERAEKGEPLSKEARAKLPASIQAELTRYEQSVGRLEQARMGAEQKARAEHSAALLAIQKQLTVANELEKAAELRAEREKFDTEWKLSPVAAQVLGEAKPANKFQTSLYFDKLAAAGKAPKKSGVVGNKSKWKPIQAVPKEAAHLVGIAVHKGAWFGTPMLTSIQPIFEGKTGRFRGEIYGKKGEDLSLIVEAKPGYVVSQISVSAPNDHVHGIKLIFQKVDTFRQSTVADDSYSSEWLGIEHEGKSEKVGELNKIAIGLHGAAGDWVSALGLLQAQ